MRSTLESIERRLDPEQFARVNRGAIVNVGCIGELHPWTNGEYRIRMRDSSELMWTRRFVGLQPPSQVPMWHKVQEQDPAAGAVPKP